MTIKMAGFCNNCDKICTSYKRCKGLSTYQVESMQMH